MKFEYPSQLPVSAARSDIAEPSRDCVWSDGFR